MQTTGAQPSAIPRATRLDSAAVSAFYSARIAPKVADIEYARSKAANSFWWRATLAVLLNSALATAFAVGGFHALATKLDAGAKTIELFINVMMFSVIGCAVFMYVPVKAFQKKTKSLLLEDIVRIFPGFTYNAERQMPAHLIKQSDLFPGYERDTGGDMIEGIYHDTAIMSANLCLESDRRDSKGRKQTVTEFKGPVYHLGFPRRFRGITRVRRDSGWIGNKVRGLFANGLQRVTLEDPMFESVFEVYSSDQIEARYILTTGFMELLLRVASRHKNNLEAAFFDQHVLLKVQGQTARLQITSPLKPIDWQAEVTRLVDEFQDAFALADELKLNQKIGL